MLRWFGRGLALALLFVAVPAPATDFTKTYSLSNSWMLIGTPPFDLQADGGDIYYFQADAPPAASVKGQVLRSIAPPKTLTYPQPVYARLAGSQAASVTTTPFVIGNGSVLDAAGRLPVTRPDTRATSQSLSAALGQYIDIPINGQSIVGLKFVGLTASGATITYYSSNDATATPTSPISSHNASTGVSSSTRTADGETRVPVSGRAMLRLQVTTGGTGTIAVSYNVSSEGTIFDIGGPLPPGSNLIGQVTDPNNASYGAAGAPTCAAITPGSATPATPCRVMHWACPPSTTPGQAYTSWTAANGDTDTIPGLTPGAEGWVPGAVTYIAALTTVSGTVSCTFKNHN